MSTNLFASLERHALNHLKTAEENLITEIFVYLLNYSKILRKRFIAHLALESTILVSKYKKKEFRKSFNNPVIKSQVPYKKNIIDIQISSRAVNDKISIENKINANEGFSKIGKKSVNQIQKYLNAGLRYVAFLTPCGTRSPEVGKHKKNYLGHFYWQDVYSIIEKYNRKQKSQITAEFLKHLEEKNMKPIKQFTKNELRNASTGFDFIIKASSFLEKISSVSESYFRNVFGNVKLSEEKRFSRKYIQRWFRLKGWNKSKLWLGFDIVIKDGTPCFFVEIGVSGVNRKSVLENDNSICQKVDKLQKVGWEKDENSNYWMLYKSFKLSYKKDIDQLVNEMVDNIKTSINELRSKEIQIIGLINRRF
jgi:hypothetical protein